jgi:hypothetical protein
LETVLFEFEDLELEELTFIFVILLFVFSISLLSFLLVEVIACGELFVLLIVLVFLFRACELSLLMELEMIILLFTLLDEGTGLTLTN